MSLSTAPRGYSRLKTKIIRTALAVLVAFIVTVLPFLTALAIEPPDYKSINAVYAYRNLLLTGDEVFIADFTWSYSVIPTLNINETVIVQLYDADSEVVATTVPFSFYNHGYVRGAVIFYLPPDIAADWTSAVTVKFVGNPTLSWNGTAPVESSSVSYWSVATTQAASQAELAARIVSLAGTLASSWSLTDMTQSTPEGTKLDTNGIEYFNGVLQNIQAMAPDAFPYSIVQPAFERKTYNNDNALSLIATTVGTPLDLTALATATHIGTAWLGAIIVIIVIVVIDVIMLKRTRNMRGIVLLDDFVFLVAAVKGVLVLNVLVGLGALLLIITGFALFYRPSGA